MIFLKIIFRNVFFSRAALLLVETLRSFAKKRYICNRKKQAAAHAEAVLPNKTTDTWHDFIRLRRRTRTTQR